jgi:hypothetical protein
VYDLKTLRKIATFTENDDIYSLDFSDGNRKLKVYLVNDIEPKYLDLGR